MQIDFISQVGRVVMVLSVFKAGHLNPAPCLNDRHPVRLCWHLDVPQLHSPPPTHTHTYIWRHCGILFAYSDTHSAHATHTAWQWPWYMYVCKTGRPFYCRPGPNHSSTLSRETTSQPLSLATEVTEENTWPWCIHPFLHLSLLPFIHCPHLSTAAAGAELCMHTCMHIHALISWGHWVAVKNGRHLFIPPPPPGL